MNIQALIAQGLITDVASVDPNKAYVAVGVFQPGNRPAGSANANSYPSYAMPISEFLAAGGIYTASNGIALVGNDFQLASLNISQFTNDSAYITSSALTGYVQGTGTIGYVPRWNLTDTLGNSIIFDDGLGNVGIGISSPTSKLHVNGITTSTGASIFKVSFPLADIFNIDDSYNVNFVTNNGVTITGSNGSLNLVSNGGTSPSIGFKFNNGVSTSGIIYGNGLSMGLQTPLFALGSTIFTSSATLHVKGVDATLANYALKVDNSASTPLLYVRNDGLVSINQTTIGAARLEITGGAYQGIYAQTTASICINANDTSGIAVKGEATTGVGLQGNIGGAVGSALKLDDNVNGVLLMKVGSNGTKSIVNIVNIPTSAAGLSAGDLWNNAGVINIV